MRLLHVDSSILGSQSASRELTAGIVEAERRRHPGVVVVNRDLAADPLQHLSGAHLAAAFGKAELPESLRSDAALGASDLEVFLAADVIVLGAPMYNFTVPTQLKAWIDRLAVKGKTFNYGADGPEGLCVGKKMIIASNRGGAYGAGSPAAFLDHQETYLRGVFNFFGVTDITFVRAEGLNMTDNRGKSIENAKAQIAALV
jgi:FMN-dependent NADH-azoreductase